MKREGHLMERIATRPNLAAAFHLAARGKRARPEVRGFAANLDRELGRLVARLERGSYQPGPFRRFTVRDPKVRLIHAAPFADRVVHHAIMRIAGPRFERGASEHSYACRLGRGNHAALQQAQRNTRRHAAVLHLDMRKYFDSVDHGILSALITRRFKDAAFLELLCTIIAAYQTAPGKGLPIGTLCSQVFANMYLDGFDRFVGTIPGVAASVRFMDDVVVWAEQPDDLVDAASRVSVWLASQRQLTLKGRPAVRRCCDGFRFLGHRVTRQSLFPDRRSRRRFRRRFRELDGAREQGLVSELEFQRRSDALLAAVGGRAPWLLAAHGRAG